MGQVHEGRVREIHGSIAVADHQCIQGGKIRVVDRGNQDRARAKECPRGVDLSRVIAHQMKQLGQNGGRRQEGQPKRLECLDADLVPPVIAIEERQDRSGVDQPASGHDAR